MKTSNSTQPNPPFVFRDVTEIPDLDQVVDHYPVIKGVCPECLDIPDIQLRHFRDLCVSIASIGLQTPITLTHDGRLADGRCRLRACYLTNVEPRFQKLATNQAVFTVALAN